MLTKAQERKVLKLNLKEQEEWLNQHLPNRVAAAWVDLPNMKGEWEWKGQRSLGLVHFAKEVNENQIWCYCRAVENGQKAAMRFLIEFVGIRLKPDLKPDSNNEKKGIPDRPSKFGGETDVSIQSFTTDGSDLQIALDTIDESSKAWILARVWNGCTQSCVYPTFKTGHYRADPPDLAKGFPIIVEHLQAKLYGPRGGKSLSQIVREQH